MKARMKIIEQQMDELGLGDKAASEVDFYFKLESVDAAYLIEANDSLYIHVLIGSEEFPLIFAPNVSTKIFKYLEDK